MGVSTLAALAASTADARTRPGLIVPVVDARRGQVFYGLYSNGAAMAGQEPQWARMQPYAVCDRGELGGRVPREATALNDGSCDGAGSVVTVVGEDVSLVPDLATGMAFEASEVRAEYLVLGQHRLLEPGVLPEGDRLGGWLLRETRTTATGGAPGRSIGEPGTPESVKPIYVRSPDADIHIKKMRDPWAAKTPDS